MSVTSTLHLKSQDVCASAPVTCTLKRLECVFMICNVYLNVFTSLSLIQVHNAEVTVAMKHDLNQTRPVNGSVYERVVVFSEEAVFIRVSSDSSASLTLPVAAAVIKRVKNKTFTEVLAL